MHTMIQAARPKSRRLHNAPFVERPDKLTGQYPRVLDLGFGTGIWLLDMANKYERTEFYGLDLANMIPPTVHHNLDFRPHVDYESPWAMGESSFDLIHLQMGLGSVGNWPLLYDRIYKHLKPGAYFEHVEIDWEPRCSDGTLRKGKYTDWWFEYVSPPYRVASRPINYNPDTGLLLHQKGFVNIQHEEFRIPTNGWSNDRAERVSGTWWENAMGFGQDRGHGFEAMSLAVLTRWQNWPAEHARKLCADAMAEAGDPRVHAYNVLHIWWAQKPTNAPR